MKKKERKNPFLKNHKKGGKTETKGNIPKGKTIEPQKKVSASQGKAVEDVAKNLNKDLKPMEATMLYNAVKDSDLPTIDFENGTETFHVGEDGLKSQMFKSLEKKDYVVDMGGGDYTITPKGKEFVDRVKGRIETRKNVKAGIDLFPETANIPEVKTKETKSTALKPAEEIKPTTLKKEGEPDATTKQSREKVSLGERPEVSSEVRGQTPKGKKLPEKKKKKRKVKYQ